MKITASLSDFRSESDQNRLSAMLKDDLPSIIQTNAGLNCFYTDDEPQIKRENESFELLIKGRTAI